MKGCYKRLYWFFLIQQSHSDKARKYWRLRWALRVAVFLGEGPHCQTFFRHAASFSSETHSGICILSGASIWNVSAMAGIPTADVVAHEYNKYSSIPVIASPLAIV